LSRILFAVRSFFSIVFFGKLPEDIAAGFGYEERKSAPVIPPVETPKISDGALQILHILQCDSRFLDFVMDDISGYTDDQVGGAVRALHDECKVSLSRHFSLVPVIEGVEGTFQRLDASKAPDPNRIKLIGNVPANGKVSGGTLRHRGWMAFSVNLPRLDKQDATVLAPAELEIE
jgi:hypothetical protein